MISRLAGYKARQRRRRLWYRAVSAMACLVVFCTTYALILPALTMEHAAALDCPLAVHQHTPDCYDESGALQCGQADFVVHSHDAACFDENGELVCLLPSVQAHSHTDACYDEDGGLLCGRDEIVLHTHTDACYDGDGGLICGQLQVLEHQHTDACFPAAEETPDGEAEMMALDAGAEDEGIAALDAGESSSFALTYGGYTITFNIVDGGGNPIAGDYSQYDIEAEDAVRYIFGAADAGTTETNIVSRIAPEIDGYIYSGANSVVSSDGTKSWAQGVYSVGTDGYEADYGGTVSGFKFYTTEPLSSGGFLSWGYGNYTVTLTYLKELGDLGGQSFAIVNRAGGDRALTAESATVNGVPGLASQAVTVETGSEGYQVTGNVTLWTFMRQADGTYYISTTVDGKTKYLRLYETPYDSSNDGRGSLTLSDDPQEITVKAAGSGVALTVGVSVVNRDSGAAGVFWCYNDGANPNSQLVLAAVRERETVQGISPKGTVINLFDYWTNENGDRTTWIGADPNAGINAGHALKFTYVSSDDVGTANKWTGSGGGVLQGIVANRLGTDGFPVLSGNTAILTAGDNTTESLAYLFDPDYTGSSSAYRAAYRNVGGLLQEDSEDGYYYYDSTKNYAYFDETKNGFTLYKDWGVSYKTANGTTNGMFFPFDDYPDSQSLTAEDAGLNHYFGMTLTSRFVHRHNGYTSASRHTPTTFSFSGDDDVWIFIDGVLVADLGGNHDAASVDIDFAKGTVTIDKVYGISDSNVVRNFSTIFADTDVVLQENTVTVDGVETTYKTFEDNSYHVLKFYYLERGGYASNLHLQYNLASYPPISIKKVDQYKQPVQGAAFAVYKADEGWNITDKTPAYTGTTDAGGEIVFEDKDGMPYTLAELGQKFGTRFILRETGVPAGYRQVSQDVHLYIENNVLLCDNTYGSGAWAEANLQISAPDTIQLVDNRTISVLGSDGGKIFAVVLKYIGPRDDGIALETDLKKRENWAPVYGNSVDGFTVVWPEEDTSEAFLQAVIDTAQNYTESNNEFDVGTSGALEGGLSGLPGDISTYYYMLPEGDRGQAQYTVAYYWTQSDLKSATTADTFRVDADAAAPYGFDRVFGATVNVPNLSNRMAAQKFDDIGQPVNGAAFALYKVEQKEGETAIYYIADDGTVANDGTIADDGTRLSLTEGEETAGGFIAGKASVKGDAETKGTYSIDPKTGVITVAIGEESYTITPAKTAVTCAAGENDIGEDGTAQFDNLLDGQYYLREIAAPKGYELNLTQVMVLVTKNAIYANAGTATDGVTVARGSGYVVATLDQFASEGDIDNTLTWVYERMRISGVSTSFAEYDDYETWGYLVENGSSNPTAPGDSDGALTVYLKYDASDKANTLFNYTVNWARYGENDLVTRRLYTPVGWSYYELYQDYEYGSKQTSEDGANYTNLHGQEIANLFSRAVYVQMTDQPKTADLTIRKVDANQKKITLAGAQFVLYRMAGEEKYYYSYTPGEGENEGTVRWTLHPAEDLMTLTTGDTGEIAARRVPDGVFYLEETAAPIGYAPLTQAIAVTVENGKITGCGSPASVQIEEDGVTLIVANQPYYELPETGGAGALPYVLGGAALMGWSLLACLARRRESRGP